MFFFSNHQVDVHWHKLSWMNSLNICNRIGLLEKVSCYLWSMNWSVVLMKFMCFFLFGKIETILEHLDAFAKVFPSFQKHRLSIPKGWHYSPDHYKNSSMFPITKIFFFFELVLWLTMGVEENARKRFLGPPALFSAFPILYWRKSNLGARGRSA